MLFLIIDELDSLGQIDGLKDALARVRKFGSRCVLGFQSILCGWEHPDFFPYFFRTVKSLAYLNYCFMVGGTGFEPVAPAV